MGSSAPTPGRIVGRYALVRELGHGGMGTVFLARDPKLDREVAIKFVSVESPVATQRFLAEARVTARCKHPNIVDIYEIADDDGQPYIVLEYVEGESARATLERGRLSPDQAIAIMTQVARGLAYAHSRGIIHRDLKPANILVTTGGVAKLVDFGIAKQFNDEEVQAAVGHDRLDEPSESLRDLTATDELPGTLHYLAPEQARREPTDDRVDLWAFGVTLFELLAGRRPLEGMAAPTLLGYLADLELEVPRLATVAPWVPPALCELTDRCLEKRVELRIGSAGELVGALEAVATQLTAPAAIAPTPAPPAPRPASPGPRVVTARRATALAITLAAVVAVAVAWARCAPSTPAAARVDRDSVRRARALVAELARLDERGAIADGDKLLADFVADERGPDGLALAWLAGGDRARIRAGAWSDEAMTSYVSAYARAADPAIQRAALIAVSRTYLERWEWDRLAAALDGLDEMPGPDTAEVEALRAELRLATRAPAATPRSGTARPADRLLSGRPTDLVTTDSTAVDVDGDGALDLVALEGDELTARTATTLAVLSRRPVAPDQDLRCAGRDERGAYAVIAPKAAYDRNVLVPLDGGPARALAPGLTASIRGCRWLDVDGEHGPELYLLSDRGLIRVARGADDAWTETPMVLGGEVWDVIAGDLDGDGRRELVVALGQWRAYEVRLVRVEPDGSLRILDRVRLGVVSVLADLGRDDAGQARIAAIKVDVYPSLRDLPADRPLGAPAGLYVLGVAGERLQLLRRVDVPGVAGDPLHRSASRHFPDLGPLRAIDLDGDGRRDLVAGIKLVAERPNLLVALGRADGGFAVHVISGVDPQAVLDPAGDRAARIVATVEGAAGAWILGDGTTPLPPRAATPIPLPPPAFASGLDRSIAAAWRRAEQLARIGQAEAAAAALERVATTTESPLVKVAALSRAALLLAADGRSAAATYEAIARLPTAPDATRVQSWLAAIDDDLARVALVDARDRAARLRASGLPLTPADQAHLAAIEARLPGAPRQVFDGEVLDPAWRIADPSLVHVVPGSRHLTVETLREGEVAALPLAPDPRGVTVVLDAEITRMEWAGNLEFRLGPHDPAVGGGISVRIGSRGGGRVYTRAYLCQGTYPSALERFAPLPDSDAMVAVRIELSLVPGERRARCTIVVDGKAMTSALDVTPAATRDWTFSIAADRLASTTSAVARIKTIAVAGASPTPAPSSDLDAAGRALAAHRADLARTLLAAADRATTTTWPAVRLAVIAAEELGDPTAATAILTDALAGPEADRPTPPQLASLARARDGQFMPVVRAAAGRRAAVLLAAAWEVSAYQNLDQPRVRAALIRDLDELPAPTPETQDATRSLLGFLGEALLVAGRPDDARRALVDALALAPATEVRGRDRAERVAFLLAADAAARGDEPAARRWALASLDLGNHPELAADRILLDPRLRALAAGPGWERIVELGRPLATVP